MPWRTYRACLEAPPEADWLIVIQDDGLPCHDFASRVKAILSQAEGRPTALFLPNTARVNIPGFREAQAQGETIYELTAGAWRAITSAWIPVVALAWPIAKIRGFLGWADQHGYSTEKNRADDAVVGDWARSTLTPIFCAVPCLVEHPDESRSLAKSHSGGAARTAVSFVDA